MKTRFLFFFVAVAALAVSACGGGGGGGTTPPPPPPPAITVSVTPPTATLAAGATQQFTATVTNATNTAVTWSWTSTALTGQPAGALSAAGLYTAPTTVEADFTVTVKATSVADTTVSATATITVDPPADQPQLVWSATPGSADIWLSSQLSQLLVDNSGNVFFTGGASTLSAWKFSPDGKVLDTFTNTDGFSSVGGSATDGTNLYLAGNLNGKPALVSLDSNLNKRYEATPCGSMHGGIGPPLWDATAGKLLLGIGLSSSTTEMVVAADPSTGQFPCSDGIVVQPTADAGTYSLSLSVTGKLTAFGTVPETQPSCWTGYEWWLGQASLSTGAPVWLDTLSQLAPDVLSQAQSVETVENGRDVIYVTGELSTCQRGRPLWTAKYDGATGQLLWSQTWDTGNTNSGAGVSGYPTPLLLPGGGVAVVGSATQLGEIPPSNGHATQDIIFVAYDAAGNQLVAEHVPFDDGADVILDGAALTPDGKGFYAGGMLFGYAQALILKFTLPASLLAGN